MNDFTNKIKEILQNSFGKEADVIFELNDLLKYINTKTRSANKGSKSRGSFANLYALYVLLEDYKNKNFLQNQKYSTYEGAIFSELLQRQRELPFGAKLQNHALNHRLNEEFKKYFPTSEISPIIRDVESNRYWINESLIKVKLKSNTYNLCLPIIEIIDEYIKTKKDSFEKFIRDCENLKLAIESDDEDVKNFIISLLAPNVDARLFEIISYSILKYYYFNQEIYWGFEIEKIQKDNLKLYKTGRTNANDGGIDFVMKPLGRFFQVTETLDTTKYFLDIDKIERYPVTFVIKSTEAPNYLLNKIESTAKKKYPIDTLVHTYMSCIEEVINIPILIQRFRESIKMGFLKNILDEIILQSKVEFNLP
ncbi:MAG: restriction endonuclease [Leptospiraceae bacterium]|nr:restriction endonuclease [Leptospiraceae bacterium]